MYDVVTVGSSTVDVFARSKTSELIKMIDSKGEKDLLAYPTGAKILIEELNFSTGGGATNTAVSFARLGLKVACISKIGSGPNADLVTADLKKEKVDTSLLVRDKSGRTGYSIILDSIEHDRTILAFKGSNDNLIFSEIKLNKLKTRWFYFSALLEESFNTLEKLAKFAEKKNINIVFNVSEYLASKGANFLKEILKRTEIFVLNKDEAKLIVSGNDIKDLLVQIHKLGPRIVVITDGKKEVDAFDGTFIYSFIPTNIKIVETTGAGDAFASSFLTGMIKRNNIEFALKLASANSESVIQHHGAKNKLLTFNEALKIIKAVNLKVKKKKV